MNGIRNEVAIMGWGIALTGYVMYFKISVCLYRERCD
jgi:hypothetical protein